MRLRLFVFLSASLLFLLFGCGRASNVDPGPEQLMEQINDYRAGQSLPPLIYDAEVAAVAQGYAQYLDNRTPHHQYPYSEDADGKGLSVRLTDFGISVSTSAEVGRSDPDISNAYLFFSDLDTAELLTVSRIDVDSMGVGHVSPPSGYSDNHYWILDLVKRAAPALTADFTGSPLTGTTSDTFIFTDASTGTITTWAWNFGSGASIPTANTQGPHYVTYSTTGSKTVTLTVTGPGGSDIETKTDYITINP
jgi:PKD repeat protein